VQDLTIAIVGATGAVGTELIRIIEQRHPKLRHIKLLASSRSAGKRLTVNGRELVVEETSDQSFRGVDIAFISVSTEISRRLAPIAVAAGAVVIDDSSAFRMQPEVPLVVPEINGADVAWHRGIIAIPNCATTPVVMAGHPLHHVNPIRRITAATYQSVSGAGAAAVAELREQSRRVLDGGPATPAALPHQIAFNVIPRIDSFLPSGYTREEQKMADETRKIMHAPEIAVSATCVRVPVSISHSAALHLEFARPMPTEEARELLARMPGVRVLDDPEHGEYPMPWDVAGADDVFVGRIRRDQSHPNGLALWVVSDNLRKGAALNSLQIAEELVRRDCLRPQGDGHHKSEAPPETRSERHGEVSTEAGRGTFDDDLAFYQSHLEELLRDYRGRWIAIIKGSVVDTDAEFATLAKRVYARHGYKAILMTRVEAEPMVVNLHSPRLVGLEKSDMKP
jgi:aspartate-semialdehyde dehydrogenase